MNNMTLAIVRNIAYSQINKINKKIKEEIEVDSTLTKMIDINMKNAINKIINNYKLKTQLEIMFDLTHGLIFAIGSMTLIISILVIVLLLVNSIRKKKKN